MDPQHFLEPIPNRSSYRCTLCGKIARSRDRSKLLEHVSCVHLNKGLRIGNIILPLCKCDSATSRGYPKHVHCSLCDFVVQSNEFVCMKAHYDVAHAVKRIEPAIICQPLDPITASAAIENETVNSLNHVIDNTEDRRDVSYQCMVETCSFICADSQILRAHERTHGALEKAESSLKFVTIDPDEGIFFVRTTTRGNDYKVHVNMNRKLCSSTQCFNGNTLICRHIRSLSVARNAVEGIHHSIDDDLDDSSASNSRSIIKRMISEEKRSEILWLYRPQQSAIANHSLLNGPKILLQLEISRFFQLIQIELTLKLSLLGSMIK